MKTRVILADDHKIVREGLKSLLEKQPDIEVIGEARDGQEAVMLAEETVPDVVVIDIAMPNLNGIEAARAILAKNASIKVIALSMYAEPLFVTRMLEAGASGYVLKDCAFEELNQAIHTVTANETFLSPKIVSTVVKDYIKQLHQDKTSPLSMLTVKERGVLQLITEGKSTKDIAIYLSISVKTVETHRKNIMDKLGIRSIAELTKYSIREGITSL